MAEFNPDEYLKRKDQKATGSFDPDAYLAKTAPSSNLATQFGRSAASLADTIINTATGTLDWAAYPLARAAGLSPEEATAQTTSPKDIVGRAFGIEQTPEYKNEASRQLMQGVGDVVGEYAVQPVTSVTGLPEQDVANMVNTAMLGLTPPVVRGAKAVGNVVAHPIESVKTVAKPVADVAQGAYGAVTGKIAKPGVEPEVWQTPSSRVPVGEKYMTPADLQAWRAGEITTQEAQAGMRPSTELPARALQSTEGNIPYAGQGWRALGEQIGEVYRNPMNVLTDVGLDVLTGSPLPTMARLGYKGYKALQQARGANELANLGFSPLYPNEITALTKGQEHPSYLGPVPVQGAPLAPIAPAAPVAAATVVQPTVQPVTPMLGYDPTVQPVRSFSERPQAPQPFYADQQGNVSGARPLAGSEAGYQERLTAAQQIQAATDEALAKQRAKVDADMAAMEASRLQAEQLRAADLARKQAEAEAQKEALRQQIAAKNVTPIAPTEVVPAVETPAPKVSPTPDEIRAMIEAKKKKPAATEEPAPAAEGPVAPTELPPESITNESPFEWADKPQERIWYDIPENASKPEVRHQLKKATNAFITQKNKQVKIDKTVFDDIAKQYGETINWDDLKEYNSLPEARENVRKLVYDTIKDKVAVTKLGERYSTIVKREEATKTPEQRAAEDAAAREIINRVNSLRNRSKSGEMGMMIDESGPTFANLDEFNQEFFANTLGGKETVGIVADRNAVVTKKRGEYGDNIDIKGLLDDGTEVYITQDPIGGFNPIIGLTNSKPTDLTTSYTVKRDGHSINQVYKNDTLEYERVTYPNGDADTWYASTGGERSYGRDLRKQAPIAKMVQDLIK